MKKEISIIKKLAVFKRLHLNLRILPGKTHSRTNLRRFRKNEYVLLGSWCFKLTRDSYLEIEFSKK